MLRIDFTDEAGETYENIVLNSLQGFVVQITVAADDEHRETGEEFDATIVGPGTDWYDAVIVRAFDDERGAYGDPFTVRAERILVY